MSRSRSARRTRGRGALVGYVILGTLLITISVISFSLGQRNHNPETMIENVMVELSGVKAQMAVLQQERGSISRLEDTIDELRRELVSLEERLYQEVAREEFHQPITNGITTANDTTSTSIRILPGDTIWDLARRFQDPPSYSFILEVLAFNQIADASRLRVGDVIEFPVRETSTREDITAEP